ncbi:hypothetical protein C8J57DRAFT_1471642 [Mycena rebaudengoi]|nr:hypothetical protein C8J57DRAFT_1471642 [Mycena rebaudengoi]
MCRSAVAKHPASPLATPRLPTYTRQTVYMPVYDLKPQDGMATPNVTPGLTHRNRAARVWVSRGTAIARTVVQFAMPFLFIPTA